MANHTVLQTVSKGQYSSECLRRYIYVYADTYALTTCHSHYITATIQPFPIGQNQVQPNIFCSCSRSCFTLIHVNNVDGEDYRNLFHAYSKQNVTAV